MVIATQVIYPKKGIDTILAYFQYSFDISQPTDTIMVCLDQEDVSAGKQTGAKHLEIGFSIWQVNILNLNRLARFFGYNI